MPIYTVTDYLATEHGNGTMPPASRPIEAATPEAALKLYAGNMAADRTLHTAYETLAVEGGLSSRVLCWTFTGSSRHTHWTSLLPDAARDLERNLTDLAGGLVVDWPGPTGDPAPRFTADTDAADLDAWLEARSLDDSEYIRAYWTEACELARKSRSIIADALTGWREALLLQPDGTDGGRHMRSAVHVRNLLQGPLLNLGRRSRHHADAAAPLRKAVAAAYADLPSCLTHFDTPVPPARQER